MTNQQLADNEFYGAVEPYESPNYASLAPSPTSKTCVCIGCTKDKSPHSDEYCAECLIDAQRAEAEVEYYAMTHPVVSQWWRPEYFEAMKKERQA